MFAKESHLPFCLLMLPENSLPLISPISSLTLTLFTWGHIHSRSFFLSGCYLFGSSFSYYYNILFSLCRTLMLLFKFLKLEKIEKNFCLKIFFFVISHYNLRLSLFIFFIFRLTLYRIPSLNHPHFFFVIFIFFYPQHPNWHIKDSNFSIHFLYPSKWVQMISYREKKRKSWTLFVRIQYCEN